MALLRSRGLVCVVTDRHRLLPGADTAAQLRALADQARAAAQAGADLFQLRERGIGDGMLLELARSILEAAAGSATRVIVNDRLDIALAAGADGVQLPAAGIPPAEARRIVPQGWLVGASAHTEAESQAAADAGADFAIFGTVFPSVSKRPDHRWAGVRGLQRAASGCRIPVLAIGGIDGATVREVAAVCAGVAAIGWFATRDARALGESVRLVRSVFDTAERLI